MPLYTIATQAGTLDGPRKASLAAEITALHVEIAGVPKEWVHVLFQDYAPGSGFSAGQPAPMVSLSLTIRTGRSADYKRNLLTRLWALLRTATAVSDDQIVIGLQEVPPSDAMEMARIMPDVS